MPTVTDLQRNHHGWLANVDGVPVYIRDGNAYWMREVFTGTPLTRGQQSALDQAAYVELYGTPPEPR